MQIKLNPVKLTYNTAGFMAESGSVDVKDFCKMFDLIKKLEQLKTTQG